jgi:hypothetical protein
MRTRFLTAVLLSLAMGSLLASQAAAKYNGPLTLVTPSGDSFRVEGRAADLWWSDWAGAPRGGCTCRSAEAAARYSARMLTAWNVPPYPDVYEAVAPGQAPTLVFAPAERRLWRLVTPAVFGTVDARWDRWVAAGPHISRIISAGEQQLADAPPGSAVVVNDISGADSSPGPASNSLPGGGGSSVAGGSVTGSAWLGLGAASVLALALLLSLLRRGRRPSVSPDPR